MHLITTQEQTFADSFINRPNSKLDMINKLINGQKLTNIKTIELKDSRYKDMEKWKYKTKSKNSKDSVIHYFKDPKTGKLMDFKFKKHSTGEIPK